MNRIAGAIALLVLVLGLLQPLAARPQYLVTFQADPYRRAEVDGCGTCHVNPAGGGARNDFGSAFEAASHDITPMLRASFPQQFAFDVVKLPDGSTFSFSDPAGKFAVIERAKQRTLVDLGALSAPKTAPLPPAETRMSFFVTSKPIDTGGQLGGLAGADRHCQDLAKDVGAGDRMWRAYLSTSFDDRPAINAGDRIGSGPWYNAKSTLVARGPADLHAKGSLAPELLVTEKGQPIGSASSARPVVLTGSLPNGVAAVGKNCKNWTSAADGDAAASGDGSWNSSGSASCAPDTVSAPLLYCFALR
jgi:hypothetical protein